MNKKEEVSSKKKDDDKKVSVNVEKEKEHDIKKLLAKEKLDHNKTLENLKQIDI